MYTFSMHLVGTTVTKTVPCRTEAEAVALFDQAASKARKVVEHPGEVDRRNVKAATMISNTSDYVVYVRKND